MQGLLKYFQFVPAFKFCSKILNMVEIPWSDFLLVFSCFPIFDHT